jgi:hypothetical protein
MVFQTGKSNPNPVFSLVSLNLSLGKHFRSLVANEVLTECAKVTGRDVYLSWDRFQLRLDRFQLRGV